MSKVYNYAWVALLLGACGSSQQAEPIVPTDASVRADAHSVDASTADTQSVFDNSTRADTTLSDLVPVDNVRPDLRTGTDTHSAVDSVVQDHTAQVDSSVTNDANTTSDVPLTYLPTLRVEIFPDFGLDDMRVDWENPDGAVCDEFNDSSTCNWGDFGSIAISGDDYGRSDPNWAEISGARANNGIYLAEVTSMCDVDDPDCIVTRVRIYVDGVQVREIDNDVEVYAQAYLCMPAAGSAWNVAAFWWGQYGCTRPDAN